MFDDAINTNGLQEKVVELLVNWVKEQNLPGLKVEVVKEPNRTPVILCEVEATQQDAGTILLYGCVLKLRGTTSTYRKLCLQSL